MTDNLPRTGDGWTGSGQQIREDEIVFQTAEDEDEPEEEASFTAPLFTRRTEPGKHRAD